MVSFATLRVRTILSTLLLLALGGAASACVDPPNASDAVQAGTKPQAKGPKRKPTIPADGWNDQIAWRGLEEGLREAKQTGRPLMMVVHTQWCPKCRALKQTFNEDPQVERLSESFVMVHVDQDAEPSATLYAPDGTYIPRVVFLDAEGKLDPELSNSNRTSKFRYFYTPQEDLVGTMREALDRHGNKS